MVSAIALTSIGDTLVWSKVSFPQIPHTDSNPRFGETVDGHALTLAAPTAQRRIIIHFFVAILIAWRSNPRNPSGNAATSSISRAIATHPMDTRYKEL